MKFPKSASAARLLLAACLALPLAASAAAAAATPADHATKGGVAWFKGDVDAAFAQAKASNKPLFLYWGAVWCPYCNQVKATIFTRQAFIERSRHFIPVYLDGDAPGAQKVGAHFKVRGYPTMILFKPDGSEITRLPGEIDASRYLQVLAAGMSTTARPARETLQAALADPAGVKADEWRLLAFYSWDQGEQSLVGENELPSTLQKLAQSVPAAAGDAATRLDLAFLIAAANAKPAAAPTYDKAAAIARVSKLLADPKAARDHMDIFVNSADKLLGSLTAANTPERAAFAATLDGALVKLAGDAALSRTDRAWALAARGAVARLQQPSGALDAGLLKAISQGVAALDKGTTDIYERQSVIYAASSALNNADLLDESTRLLTAELKRSHSPYYFMSGLAGIAKKRGDSKAALDWYEQAYGAAKGPFTRIRWGTIYANNLIDLAPADGARIEKAVAGVIAETETGKDLFYEGSLARLQAMGKKVQAWNRDTEQAETVARLQTRLDAACAKLPAGDPQAASCTGLLGAKPAKS